ncbi:MAG: ROK family transcriptional regulator [Anaerolineaceae bacterium]|nr:ROK family transcriptional regulator [Anaerolineaceae bacterium]
MPKPDNNKQLLKALNRSLVLNAIKRFNPISRADVARMLGLSPATITSLTAEMIGEGLIFEKAAGNSSGGRPPVLLAINPHGGFAVGLKLTESEVIAALTDLEATLIAKARLPWGGQSVRQASEVINNAIEQLIEQAKINRKQILGVGIGLAGVVNVEAGKLLNSPYLPWKNLDLTAELQKRLRIPVYIDNDVNTLTLAEKWFGAGQGYKDFIVVTLGRGVGMGIVVNNQLQHGKHGGAGELGHIVVQENGALCSCGKRGCLEAYIGDSGLVKMAQSKYAEAGKPKPDLSIDALTQLAFEGDSIALEVMKTEASYLGQTLANLLNILDPALIVLGGEGLRAGELLLREVKKMIAAHVINAVGEDFNIISENWGDDAWARGAASLVLKEIFELPINKEEKAPVR